MRTPSKLLTAFALLAIAACGAPGQESGGAAGTGAQPLEQDAGPVAQTMDFGEQYRFGYGLSIMVSTPKSFQPSSGAYPQSARAVAFDISVRNDGGQPYQLSGLSVSATIGGVPAKQVVDSTLGYTGITNAGKDVPPGHDADFTLAFAVPQQPTQLRLTVRPATDSSVVCVYSGSA